MKHIDRILDDILASEPHERELALRSRTQVERDALFVLWAESERLRVTDIVALPQPYQAELVSFVVGDPRRGRVGVGRMFEVEAVNGPVSLERGMRANKRLFYVIDKRTTLDARQAIHALGLYGPDAEMPSNRNKLREVGYTPSAQVEEPEPKGKKKAA